MLLALLRLGPDAYGTSIRREIEAHTRRSVSVGALYTALERLERKGYATSSLADPTPQRGGRAKRYYALSPLGHKALRRSRDVIQKMWRGLEPKRGES